jgi:hypothetical protein
VVVRGVVIFDEFHSLAILCAEQLPLRYSCIPQLFQLQLSLLLVASNSSYWIVIMSSSFSVSNTAVAGEDLRRSD